MTKKKKTQRLPPRVAVKSSADSRSDAFKKVPETQWITGSHCYFKSPKALHTVNHWVTVRDYYHYYYCRKFHCCFKKKQQQNRGCFVPYLYYTEANRCVLMAASSPLGCALYYNREGYILIKHIRCVVEQKGTCQMCSAVLYHVSSHHI